MRAHTEQTRFNFGPHAILVNSSAPYESEVWLNASNINSPDFKRLPCPRAKDTFQEAYEYAKCLLEGLTS